MQTSLYQGLEGVIIIAYKDIYIPHVFLCHSTTAHGAIVLWQSFLTFKIYHSTIDIAYLSKAEGDSNFRNAIIGFTAYLPCVEKVHDNVL